MLSELKLANDLFPAMAEGGKRVTCRLGRRDVPLGHFVFVSTDPVQDVSDGVGSYQDGGETFLCCLVVVTEVRYKRLVDVTNGEAKADGFKSARSMLVGLRRFYPDIHLGSEVTLVYFQPKDC